MVRPSFFVIFGARVLQVIGIGLAFYGIFIAAFYSALTKSLSLFLIPLAGIILFIWGSKILYDREHNMFS